MLLIPCPYCGERPHLIRPEPPAQVDDETWTAFLYMRENLKGVYAERWRHARGCVQFFNALRDTTTDHFVAVYKRGGPKPL